MHNNPGNPLFFPRRRMQIPSQEHRHSRQRTSQTGILPGTLQAPVQIFNFSPPSDVLPSPVPSVDSQQQRRMKKLLNERKNWALMTPEEILTQTTLGKTSQSLELDALGRDKNQTQLERYFERQDRLQAGVTNGWQNDRAGSSWTFSHDADNANSPNSDRISSMEVTRSFSQFLNGQQKQAYTIIQNENSDQTAFNQPFSQTTTTTKPDLEQIAAMERFRQLLNPSSPMATQPSSDSQFFPVPKPAADSFVIRPEFVPNPAGASFTL